MALPHSKKLFLETTKKLKEIPWLRNWLLHKIFASRCVNETSREDDQIHIKHRSSETADRSDNSDIIRTSITRRHLNDEIVIVYDLVTEFWRRWGDGRIRAYTLQSMSIISKRTIPTSQPPQPVWQVGNYRTAILVIHSICSWFR